MRRQFAELEDMRRRQDQRIAMLQQENEELIAQANARVEAVEIPDEETAAPSVPTEPEVEVVANGAVRFDLSSSLLFSSGSSRLQSASTPTLDALGQSLVEFPNSDVYLVGHTDNRGSETTNMRLSEARAQAVAEFLAGYGVSRNRLTIEGKGEMEPVFNNLTSVGRAKNRRVEVIIIPYST
ncbi:MAG: OmpA family protein [Bacteroidota bacterium]